MYTEEEILDSINQALLNMEKHDFDRNDQAKYILGYLWLELN